MADKQTPEQIRQQREQADQMKRESDAAAREAQRISGENAMLASRVGPFGISPEVPLAAPQDPSTMELTPEAEADRARLVLASREPTPDKIDLLEARQQAAATGGSFRVQHNMVGMFTHGMVVDAKQLQEQGYDVQRLVALEAIAPEKD